MIAFCGLVCTDCPAYMATKNNDKEALRKVAEQWSKEFGANFAPEDCICDGCRAFDARVIAYCGQCQIRSCGIAKGVENCAQCAEYACEGLSRFFGNVPSARATLDAVRAGR